MPRPKRGSTLRAQWLGHMLRYERERAGFNHKQAGKALKRDGSTVSRLEGGITPARLGDVLVLSRLYKTDATKRKVMEQLSEEIWEVGWWETYSGDVTEDFIDHAWLEDRAEKMDWFESQLVPGLFQTREYAREAITTAEPDASDRQTERWLSYRLDCQQVLDKDNPPRITAILDEAVIRRKVGNAKLMREQLEHLAELAERPNINIRVVPFAVGIHPGVDGAFAVIQLPDPFPPVVHTHGAAGTAYLEHDQVDSLIAAFKRLGKVALSPEESMDLIERAARPGS